MRILVLAAIALAVGVMAGMAAANALAKRSAHSRAVMVVLARHHDALRASADEAHCTGAQTARRLAQLDFAAREIDFAFGPWLEDGGGFARRSAEFQRLAQAATAQPVASCAALAEQVAAIGRGCQDCHRDFR
jgi:cytochrome c556